MNQRRRSAFSDETNFHFDETHEPINVSTDVVVSNGDETLVRLDVSVGGLRMFVTGGARRHHGGNGIPADKHDPDVAIGLATARALRKVVKKLENQANGKSQHNDNVRHTRAAERARKEALEAEHAKAGTHPKGNGFPMEFGVRTVSKPITEPGSFVKMLGEGQKTPEFAAFVSADDEDTFMEAVAELRGLMDLVVGVAENDALPD